MADTWLIARYVSKQLDQRLIGMLPKRCQQLLLRAKTVFVVVVLW